MYAGCQISSVLFSLWTGATCVPVIAARRFRNINRCPFHLNTLQVDSTHTSRNLEGNHFIGFRLNQTQLFYSKSKSTKSIFSIQKLSKRPPQRLSSLWKSDDAHSCRLNFAKAAVKWCFLSSMKRQIFSFLFLFLSFAVRRRGRPIEITSLSPGNWRLNSHNSQISKVLLSSFLFFNCIDSHLKSMFS